MKYRIEHDTMGEVKVPEEALWGAQTQRSIEHFPVGTETMPEELIRAFAVLKKAAALANAKLGVLDLDKAEAISGICDQILAGKYKGEFPLSVWQTGSGTQTNMNVNEVIAHIAGDLHPNDDVNRSQSSNDTFPTAMHIAAATEVCIKLIPELSCMIKALRDKEIENEGIIKTGRTHLQDAVPIAFSQEISGWRGLLENSLEMIRNALPPLYRLALGGTATIVTDSHCVGFTLPGMIELPGSFSGIRSSPNPHLGPLERSLMSFAIFIMLHASDFKAPCM